MSKFMKVIAAIMLTAAVVIAAGCTKTDIPNNGSNNGGNNGGGSNNGYSYVDLGLPSGTLWATCNVGAGTSEANGYYFAWGETAPKLSYSWNNYKWCNGRWDQLTKYCNNSQYGFNGFTDNLVVLQSSDDAAKSNWGGGWRTPTYEDWNELISFCTHTIGVTPNGVNGCLFTAPNGNSLFLPASGQFSANGVEYEGVGGAYQSSSLFSDNPSENLAFVFDPSHNTFGIYSGSRWFGCSVRAVRSR